MTVKRFVTKRVEVEAFQYTGDNVRALAEWTDGNFKDDSGPIAYEDGSVVDVLQTRALVYDKLHTTWISVYPGQWIVLGAKGEFYPCDDETFHWEYEEISGLVERPADDPARFIVTNKFSFDSDGNVSVVGLTDK